MDNMNYSGLQYKIRKAGTKYTTRFADSLEVISKHTFGTVKRTEELEIVDSFMLDAFKQYKFEYDLDQLDGWSRSYYTIEEHLNSIKNYSSPFRFNKPQDRAMNKSDRYAKQVFQQFETVKSMSFHTDLDKVPFEPTSSAGLGIRGKKGDVGNHEQAINQAYATVKRIQRDGLQAVIEDSTPDSGLTRTQLTKLNEKLKVRNVFGQAFHYILLEGLSASPLMDMFCEKDTFVFVGKDPRKAVPELLQQYQRLGGKLITFDWSKFDATVEPWEILDAFDLLESILEFPDEESEIAFHFSKIFFINRKIAAPDGNVYFKQRGVPSGSYFTLLINSIINWKRIIYLSFRATGKEPKAISTQGDDAVGVFDSHVNSAQIWLAIPRQSQWELNLDKCDEHESGSQVYFLQRSLKWGDQARDVPKVERLAIYPEYEVENGQISAYRARSLWTDCNYESKILGFATLYLEQKYGVPSEVPRQHLHWWEIVFSSKLT